MQAAHDVVVLQLWHELRAAGGTPRCEAFGGKVPDLEVDPLRCMGPQPVYAEHALLEYKALSC